VIYYPKDERVLNQIYKDIAAFHCRTALQFMDINGFDNLQKEAVINSLLQDIRQTKDSTTISA
jgi:hypothetical protein